MEIVKLIVTPVVAIYAALLSTILAIMECRRRKPRLKLEIREDRGWRENCDYVVLVRVANSGMIRVVPFAWDVRLQGAQRGFGGLSRASEPVPAELQPGDWWEFYVDAEQLAQALAEQGLSGKVNVVGCCADGLGKEHTSKPLLFDIDKSQELL